MESKEPRWNSIVQSSKIRVEAELELLAAACTVAKLRTGRSQGDTSLALKQTLEKGILTWSNGVCKVRRQRITRIYEGNKHHQVNLGLCIPLFSSRVDLV